IFLISLFAQNAQYMVRPGEVRVIFHWAFTWRRGRLAYRNDHQNPQRRPDLGLPEKKKKKKKVVKEPETQYSVLNSDTYFSEICSTRATSPSKSVVLEQASEMPLVKKKKGHSTLCEECLEPETVLRAGRTGKLSSSSRQALGSSEFQGGKKKKKRKSLWPLAMPPASRVKTSPDPKEDEEVTRVGKKPKKHKKEKKTQEATASSAKDPWFCESGDALYTCSVRKDGEEQATSGQKRKQGSPRECNVKMKKKKKIHQKGDTSLGHRECSKSVERSPRKGSKKPVKIEAPEYIPIGHNPKPPAKKKMKSKKKTEQPGIEEPALKRNKKKRKESRVAGESWEEEDKVIKLPGFTQKKKKVFHCGYADGFHSFSHMHGFHFFRYSVFYSTRLLSMDILAVSIFCCWKQCRCHMVLR
uniref:Lysine rich nucleolar protein 1 n=1 Tax=Canis lupus familiaris TaxID=9615 RepID=A0A8I3Q029_CANLF